MDILQKTLDKGIEDLPRLFFEQLIAKKLCAAGISETKELSIEIADHILSGNTGPFVRKTGEDTPDVAITIEGADLDEMTSKIATFCETQFPQLLHDMSIPTSQTLLKKLKKGWGSEYKLQQNDISEFCARLEDRWGKPISQLKMLLTIAREWCQEAHNEDEENRTRESKNLRAVLLRSLVRACQVTDEIICLLENGFSDGAMARWRTLHEIAVVVAVIVKYGEGIARRCVAHQAVESNRAMEKYMLCCEDLGYKPLSIRQIKAITRKYDEAISRYGKAFKGDYGWAAEQLKKARPTLTDLEVEAGHAKMRAHHQMANDNVHAGIKSMYVRLGLPNNAGLLAGRSNAGLTDPGQNAAFTLTEITILVCSSKGNFDDIVIGRMMISLRDEIPRSFHRADRKLRQDEKKYSSFWMPGMGVTGP